MDMATIFGRYERANGRLDDMEVSDEINACSVEIEVDVNGVKNHGFSCLRTETTTTQRKSNHLVERLPCIGGAIRDPLSGVPTFTKPCVSQVLAILQPNFRNSRW